MPRVPENRLPTPESPATRPGGGSPKGIRAWKPVSFLLQPRQMGPEMEHSFIHPSFILHDKVASGAP